MCALTAGLGTRKFYIYDNNSTTPMLDSISDYSHAGLVDYNFFAGLPKDATTGFGDSNQGHVYADCIRRFRHRHRWLGFIDLDEFIVFHDTEASDINTFLHGYEKYGGLVVNWRLFGSSLHKKRPQGGVLINYTKCMSKSTTSSSHVKTIANTRFLTGIAKDPHTMEYIDGTFAVNEHKQRRYKSRGEQHSSDRIALYHYVLKSEEEFVHKVNRGNAAGGFAKTMEFFNAMNNGSIETCNKAVALGYRCCKSVRDEFRA